MRFAICDSRFGVEPERLQEAGRPTSAIRLGNGGLLGCVERQERERGNAARRQPG